MMSGTDRRDEFRAAIKARKLCRKDELARFGLLVKMENAYSGAVIYDLGRPRAIRAAYDVLKLYTKE